MPGNALGRQAMESGTSVEAHRLFPLSHQTLPGQAAPLLQAFSSHPPWHPPIGIQRLSAFLFLEAPAFHLAAFTNNKGSPHTYLPSET